MLMNAADYRESLPRYSPHVFVGGREIDSVADEPLLAPGLTLL
jgi:4-hydroxybutyryl-CoA dehydratase/vinylacetyl-CoA-Delta-isomerase